MDALGAEELHRLLRAAARRLEAAAARIDALNVFPVPDGDTGTNMLLTMRAALRAAARARAAGGEEGEAVCAVAGAAAEGALLGARGNSGVILSQILLGIAQGLNGARRAGVPQLRGALRRGSALAYAAVSRPVEGTMLTVIRAAAEAPVPSGSAEDPEDLCAFLQATLAAARRALAGTPDLLPVLREAGVVDAGGEGLCTLLEGAIGCLRGEEQQPVQPGTERSAAGVPEQGETMVVSWPASAAEQPGAAQAGESYGYCVEFMLTHRTDRGARLARELEELGTSVIVAGRREGDVDSPAEEAPVRVHLHTADPEGVIRRVGALGRVEQLQLRDMSRQHAAYLQRRRRQGAAAAAQVVAVVPGPGLARVCLSLGAAVVVVDGRCPSAEALLEAIESAPSEAVIVLPNDRNVLPVARQAARLGGKQVTVIPAMNVPQGVAALVAFHEQDNAQTACQGMLGALSGVHALEVCRAVLSTRVNGVSVRRGQHTALLDGELVAAAASPLAVIRKALTRLDMEGVENLTLYYGTEVGSREAETLAEALRADHPRVVVEAVPGGQPLHAYLVGVEGSG